MQADALQKMLTLGFRTNELSIATNQQKQVSATFYSSVRNIYNHKNFSQKSQAFQLFNQCLSNQNKELLLDFINYHHVQIPVQFSSIRDDNQLFHTSSLDNLDIVAIPTMQQLAKIIEKLKDFNMYRVKNNTEFIRDDILIYIQSKDSFYYYIKKEQQWHLIKINSLFELLFYLANFFKTTKKIIFSNDIDNYEGLNNLYKKSTENRKQYNTIAKKNAKKEAQS
ncbi:hypothetical protein [Enterococcus hirae]|uniref:hypothetical protein n=1 Tax=Enterococcus hirae TaxID=1354 RepID=UPI0021AB786C|nr:hypothetical protein [Enterococcus hirae]